MKKAFIRKAIFRTSGLAILVAGGWYGYRYYKLLPSRQETIPTTKVQRGDVVIRAFTRGELHAVRSVTLTAPNLNGTVQVTALAPVGALAREKDLIIDYDDSERLAALEESQLSVQSVDEQIKKVKADTAIQQSQDSVTLLKTRYDVRRAELEVQRNPIIDEIDAKKNILNLEQSKRALQQLEADIKARQAQADSQLAVYNEQRNRSLIDVTREMQRIAQTKSLAPITGLVAIRQNRAGFFNFGQQMPDIREGDTLQPGMPVADLLDLSELDVWTKIGELDRANLREGLDALLQLDAVPEKQFHGKIKAMSGTAASDVFSGDPSKKFDVIFSLDMRQLLSGLGMKPADVERIMATAEANAKKNVVNTAQSFFSNLQGGMQGATGPQGVPGAPNGAGGMPAPSNDQASGAVEQAGGESRRGRGRGQGGEEAGGGGRRGGAGSGGGGRGQGGEEAAGRGTLRTTLANPLDMLRRARGSPFTDEERKNAKLPLPPEEDSQVQTLLRPGLLADVEIVVEKIPDALHVPTQSVFDKNGRPTVFVLQKNGRFEPRPVQLLKQSESTMVLSSGVRPGEVIALSDPTADKSDKKAKSGEKKGGGAGAMGGMGGGGK